VVGPVNLPSGALPPLPTGAHNPLPLPGARCRVSSLCWSPDGRLLAGASCDSSRVVVWEPGLGVSNSLRLGASPHSMLAWAPCGSYLFAGGAGAALPLLPVA